MSWFQASFDAAWQARSIIKQDPERSVSVVEALGEKLLVKAFPYSIKQRMIETLGLSRSLKVSHARNKRIIQEGASIPESRGVVVVDSPSAGRLLLHCFTYIADSQNLHNAIIDRGERGISYQNSLLQQAVTQLVYLHRAKRFHGDAKLTNMLVHNGSVLLVDIDGRQISRPRSKWLRDLARFLVGVAELHVDKPLIMDIVDDYSRQMEREGFAIDRQFQLDVIQRAIILARRHAEKYQRDCILLNSDPADFVKETDIHSGRAS
ncbi:hypothetical protein [Aurantivibrio plasticivorans]